MSDAYLKVKDNGANGLSLVREESDVLVTDAIKRVYTDEYKPYLEQHDNVLLNGGVGSTVDLTPYYRYGTTYSLLIDNVVEGEDFYVWLQNGSNARPWAFLDSANKILSVAAGASALNVVITAPQNAKKLFVQCSSNVIANAFVKRYYSFKGLKDLLEDENIRANDKTNAIYNGNYNKYLRASARVPLNSAIGSTIDLSPLNQYGTDHYTMLLDGIVPGESFTINSTDGSTARPWAFLDSDNKLLSVNPDAYANNATITAPENASKLIVQCGAVHLASVSIVRHNNIIGRAEDLQSQIDYIRNGDYTSLFKETKKVSLGSASVGDTIDLTPLTESPSSTNDHYTLLIDDIIPGEYFQIYAVDGTDARPWAFLDNDNKLLSMAYNAYAQNITITAPNQAKKLLLQTGTSYITNSYVIRANSLLYLSTGTPVGINEINNQFDITEKIENAVSIRKGDYTTPVKSRADLFALVHFSDIHSDAVNIQRILDFSSKYSKYIMGILHTGDAPGTYYSDTNPFSLVGGDQVMEVVGNHECWIQGETWPRPYTATETQVYEKYFAPYISSWDVESAGTNKCYYYKDYATANTRLIVLDAIHYDSTQETWFESVLSDAAANELRVVAVTHYPAMTGLTNIKCTFGTYGETISAETPPTGTDQVERMPESAFTAVDTFIDGGGEFVCWLSGHTHGDFIGTVNGHSNQIQIIITTAKPENRFGDAARVQGTKTQDAFNVFVVDGVNKLIKLIRVGASMDRYMRTRDTLCVNYDTKVVISNH